VVVGEAGEGTVRVLPDVEEVADDREWPRARREAATRVGEWL
jgi:hypothetical protein